MEAQYKPNEVSRYIQYLDANNLYGWAMIQKLPTHGFSWEKVDITPEKIDKLVKKDKKAYILEVDVEYPKELHKNHNELPFLAERMKIVKVEKLVPNLKKVHRVIRFEQSSWMKPYIMLNTKLRTVAKNEFEKHFFKLMNNSVFGKTMENIRNHKEMKLVTSRDKYKKYVIKPNFKMGTHF